MDIYGRSLFIFYLNIRFDFIIILVFMFKYSSYLNKVLKIVLSI